MREFSRDNISLGSFRLDGISHVPLGVPQILVKFGIDAEGIGMKQAITGISTLLSEKVCFEKTVVMKSVWYLFKLKFLVKLGLE